MDVRATCKRKETWDVLTGTFAANEIPVAVLLQYLIQDFSHTLHLILVTLDGGWKLLWVKIARPGRLTEIWALPGHLKLQHLLDMILFRESLKC